MLTNTITNLVTNAIKYSPEGRPVILRTAVDDGCLRIAVIDKGMGIPPADQAHLFEPFFRAQNVLTIQGTGLGLNLVKRYLDLMGGEISFTSTPKEGTTFNVRIPKHRDRT
jgi:signal transduction histidine kinase